MKKSLLVLATVSLMSLNAFAAGLIEFKKGNVDLDLDLVAVAKMDQDIKIRLYNGAFDGSEKGDQRYAFGKHRPNRTEALISTPAEDFRIAIEHNTLADAQAEVCDPGLASSLDRSIVKLIQGSVKVNGVIFDIDPAEGQCAITDTVKKPVLAKWTIGYEVLTAGGMTGSLFVGMENGVDETLAPASALAFQTAKLTVDSTLLSPAQLADGYEIAVERAPSDLAAGKQVANGDLGVLTYQIGFDLFQQPKSIQRAVFHHSVVFDI